MVKFADNDISIGICCFNEEQNIGLLLDNLLTEQSLSSNSEIIVICSGCTDKTPEIVAEFARKDKRIRLLQEEERMGKPSAINLLLSSYQYEYLVHIDADHLPAKDSIRHLVTRFSDPKIGIISGYHIPVNENNRFMDKLGKTNMGVHNIMRKYTKTMGLRQQYGDVFWSMRRGISTKIPEDIVGDDAYIAVKCERKGFKIYLEENALAYFRTPLSIREYIAQRRRFAYGNLLIKKRTQVTVESLATLTLKDQVKIITMWLKSEMHNAPYLMVAVVLELYANALARRDLVHANNKLTFWRAAESTKRGIKKIENG